MNFGEFKANLQSLLAGDTELRTDDTAVSSMYRRALESLLADTEPLTLITTDIERFEPYRWLDDNWFIRRPALPVNDSDELDIDSGLHEVLLYLVAADLTRRDGESPRRDKYLTQAEIKKDRYTYEIFSYLQDTNGAGLSEALDRWGLLKFYRVYRSLDGYRYKWDERAIKELDTFMMHEDGMHFTPSMVNLWDQMINYQDGLAVDEEAALAELDRILCERAGGF
ncbi:MAG: hypothetical protein LBV09_08375 [Deferribacteraceae bacterium]|jgi:hypothetical protein|nr:hypothetical protein [Deferribacteraceae bacterium]